MRDVRDEDPRVAVRAQARAGLMPDEIALGHQAGDLRARRQVRPDELVAPTLIRVADDHEDIPSRSHHPVQLDEHGLHPVQVRRVVRGVGEIGGGIAHHRVIGATVGVCLGQDPAGHRERQLDVVRRIGRNEVH